MKARPVCGQQSSAFLGKEGGRGKWQIGRIFSSACWKVEMFFPKFPLLPSRHTAFPKWKFHGFYRRPVKTFTVHFLSFPKRNDFFVPNNPEMRISFPRQVCSAHPSSKEGLEKGKKLSLLHPPRFSLFPKHFDFSCQKIFPGLARLSR